MSNYIRSRVDGGTYFFTVNLLARDDNDLLVRHIDVLRDAVRRVRAEQPFEIVAWVVLPDHLHAIWTLPEGDDDYASRWQKIKSFFARALPKDEYRNPSRVARNERGIWQRRFWEHTIRDERDLKNHIDYIHFNPVKHGLVARASDWPHSTIHAFITNDVIARDWASAPHDFALSIPD
jgi:putative transposase